MRRFDVVVVGAGNAGLAAAIAAREAGATVCVLERSSRIARGGNSSLTRNIRFPHSGAEDLARLVASPTHDQLRFLADACPDPYTEEELLADWLRVSGAGTARPLVELVVRKATKTINWMFGLGHRWTVIENPLPGALQVHLRGGGAGMQETWYRAADRLGISIVYDALVNRLEPPTPDHSWLVQSGASYAVEAGAVVIAAGGFQANSVMRASELGELWRNVRLRGTALNDGLLTICALELGAQRAGNWRGCHAVPYAWLTPPHFEPGSPRTAHSATRYAYPLGIMVNASGQRFVDEAADFGNMTYASMGRQIAVQPGQRAFQIFGSDAVDKLPAWYLDDSSTVRAASAAYLAEALGIDPGALSEEISQVNSLLRSGSALLPNFATRPQRSRTILPLEPPYLGIPVVCGLTFTFGGLRINSVCAVVDSDDRPLGTLYACGEAVGGLYIDNYPGGAGLLAGATLGRLAGSNASRRLTAGYV